MDTIHFTGTPDKQIRKNNSQTEVFKGTDVECWYAGNKLLDECNKEVAAIEDQLKDATGHASVIKKAVSQEFNKWDLDTLSDYILNTHHRYAKKNAIIIYDLIQKTAYKYGDAHPELSKLASASFLFFQPLLNHLMKEEQMLFPAIRQLTKHKRNPTRALYTTFGFIKYWVMLLQKENQVAGEDMQLFRKLTNNYKLPVDWSNSFNYLLKKMKEFENDLFLYVHLENTILFPKATMLAEEFSGNHLKLINNDSNSFKSGL
jgi:regulator of cell morphogenesis and NO signaling